MNTPLTPDTYLIRDESTLGADLDDETVLMSVESGAYFGLNNTAGRVWALLETPNTPAQMEQALMQEFDVDAQTCHQSVEKLLQEMISMKLIKTQPSSESSGA